MAKFNIGDLVRVRNHSIFEESDVCEVTDCLNSDEYNIRGESSLSHYTVAACNMDLVRSVEDVNAGANTPLPKFVVGERIRYNGKAYFVSDNAVERTDDGLMICIDEQNNTCVSENDCVSAPMPNISWEDVEDIVAAKFAELFNNARQQNIKGTCSLVLKGGGYLSSNDPTFDISVTAGYISVDGNNLHQVFDAVCRRYHENEAMKPKQLPKR